MTVLTRSQYTWGNCRFCSKTGRPEDLEHFASPVSDLTTMEATESHCSALIVVLIANTLRLQILR